MDGYIYIYVARENQIINKYLEKNQLLLKLNHVHLSIYTRRKPKSSYLYNESLLYIQNITKPKFSLDIYHEEIQSFSLIVEKSFGSNHMKLSTLKYESHLNARKIR